MALRRFSMLINTKSVFGTKAGVNVSTVATESLGVNSNAGVMKSKAVRVAFVSSRLNGPVTELVSVKRSSVPEKWKV